ncbi:FecR family protein [Chitinophaga sancti]|uniref:DUF4974 domain-containing protein n=1 Tax=Chitinophaga sancti TaxID=1004 RepID=A0A1K1SJ38_9BACT|nr:FecR family protein [Chitinophaga sancti]WQD64454.1 DUF4974 domain-containing protein [Chitinophaga sancti]WQG89922.1 DUF4974 domain-containing protein [Chitinophaga sancti]SFW84342.1 FecR family protein [Chitinophaga sancti]
MGQTSFDIEDLLFKQLQGTLLPEEAAYLEAWKAEKPGNTDFFNQLTSPASLTKKLRTFADNDIEAARKEALSHLFPTRHLYKWWAAAAAIALLLTTGAYLFYKQPSPTVITQTIIAPGHPGAILTLANGSQVQLDTLQNGVIALQGGVRARIVNGSLHYEGKPAGTLYNKMSTPKGRTFQLTLPDGTNIWLNSGSAVRYPIAFNGPDRKVEISGEAYFEVAADPEKPFLVSVANKTTLTVLGTHFNVNAYDNEQAITTTLLEGAIQVKNTILKPGQQALLRPDNQLQLLQTPDINKVMAWKNGLFDFEGASLREVMRQLERWYDIEVVFEGPVPDIRFGGKMTRGIPLNEVLEILKGFEGADFKFHMEGNKRLIISR